MANLSRRRPPWGIRQVPTGMGLELLPSVPGIKPVSYRFPSTRALYYKRLQEPMDEGRGHQIEETDQVGPGIRNEPRGDENHDEQECNSHD